MDWRRGLTSNPWLFVGDLAVVAGFLFLGVLHHNGDPFGDPLYFLDTLAPFVLGWFLASFVLATYARASGGLSRELGWVSVTWVVADVVGLGLRSTGFFHGGAALGFVLVSLFGGLVFLVGWRVGRRALVSMGVAGRLRV